MIYDFFDISAIYYLDVTIVNRYGKDVLIITTHPDPAHRRFEILVGGSHRINSTLSTTKQIGLVIMAYHGATFILITIDGKNAVFVLSSVTPVSHVYYIPSGELYNYSMENT